MRLMPILITAVGLTASPVGAGAGEVHAQDPEGESAIQGVWVLNDELSDDPRPALGSNGTQGQGRRGSARGGRGPGGGGVGGFGGGRGGGRRGGDRGGGGRGGNRPNPEDMAEMREAMRSAMKDLMTAARRLTIVETEREVLLTYDDGRVVRLIPDEREHAGIAGRSMQVTRRTTWNGDTLETRIELQARMALRIERSYAVRLDGQQLVIVSTFDGERFRTDEDRELRYIYDREAR